jgi:hypothetical protein
MRLLYIKLVQEIKRVKMEEAIRSMSCHIFSVFNHFHKLSFIALSYGLDDRGFQSRQWVGIFLHFLHSTTSRSALGHTQPPIHWVTGSLSLRVKRPGREADHSRPSSAEVKNARRYTSTPILFHGVFLG